VDQHSRAFVGIDTSKLRNAVAVAEDGRDGTFAILARSTPRKRRRASSSPNLRPNTVN
jgi:hypothetical protein